MYTVLGRLQTQNGTFSEKFVIVLLSSPEAELIKAYQFFYTPIYLDITRFFLSLRIALLDNTLSTRGEKSPLKRYFKWPKPQKIRIFDLHHSKTFKYSLAS